MICLGRLYGFRYLFISFRVFNIFAYSCLWYSLMIFCVSVVTGTMYSTSFIILFTWVLTYHEQVEFIPDMQGWFNICKSINVISHINRIKDKTYMIISVGTKFFYRIQHPLMIKTVKFDIEWMYLNIITYDKSTHTVLLYGKVWDLFALR